MVQMVYGPQASFGVHVNLKRRYIDVHFLWWTISVGADGAPYSDYFDRWRWDSRGGLTDGDR